jgi:hypothetical protein
MNIGTHKGKTPNLCLVYHQVVTCNHRLHVFHGLLSNAQVGNTCVPLSGVDPKTVLQPVVTAVQSILQPPVTTSTSSPSVQAITKHFVSLACMIQNAAVS